MLFRRFPRRMVPVRPSPNNNGEGVRELCPSTLNLANLAGGPRLGGFMGVGIAFIPCGVAGCGVVELHFLFEFVMGVLIGEEWSVGYEREEAEDVEVETVDEDGDE